MTDDLTLMEKYIIDNSIFRIGKVIEISGQSVKVKVDTGKNTSSILYKGEIMQNISVQGYVKIKKWKVPLSSYTHSISIGYYALLRATNSLGAIRSAE